MVSLNDGGNGFTVAEGKKRELSESIIILFSKTPNSPEATSQPSNICRCFTVTQLFTHIQDMVTMTFHR